MKETALCESLVCVCVGAVCATCFFFFFVFLQYNPLVYLKTDRKGNYHAKRFYKVMVPLKHIIFEKGIVKTVLSFFQLFASVSITN